MRSHRLSILSLALAALAPLYMSDEAAGAPIDPNADASAAESSHESGTTSSATNATENSGADGTDVAAAEAEHADAPTLAEVPVDDAQKQPPVVADPDAFGHVQTKAGDTSSLNTDANGSEIVPAQTALVNENTGKVEVAADAHAEAKDRFAGLMAKLHQFEDEAIDELKSDLMAIATLLHLHTNASASAATTGDYKPADLS